MGGRVTLRNQNFKTSQSLGRQGIPVAREMIQIFCWATVIVMTSLKVGYFVMVFCDSPPHPTAD